MDRSERWMDLHILKQQGLRIRKIAALRGVSRHAVRRALRSSVPPRESGAVLKAYSWNHTRCKSRRGYATR